MKHRIIRRSRCALTMLILAAQAPDTSVVTAWRGWGGTHGRVRRLLAVGLIAAILGHVSVSSAAPPAGASRVAPPLGPTMLPNTTPPSVREGAAHIVSAINPRQMLRLSIALRPPHQAAEERFLAALQTPGSPLFHRYLSAEEWTARFGPTVQDEQAVVDWAQAHGLTVTQRYPNRLLVDVAAPVGAVDQAFHVSLNRYQRGTMAFFANDRDVTLPARLVGIVHNVIGLNGLAAMRPASGPAAPSAQATPVYRPGPVVARGRTLRRDGDPRSRATGAPRRGPLPHVTAGLLDPPDLWSAQAYDYGALQALGHCCNPLNNPAGSPPQTSIAIATAGDYSDTDARSFAQRFGLAMNVSRIYVDGTASCCNGESTLDTEWALATANNPSSGLNTAHIYVYVGGDNSNDTFVDIANQMLTDGLARVYSTSWLAAESGYCSGVLCGIADSPTIDDFHAIYDQMVGLGWTLVAASGDHGAYADCKGLSVNYPSSDPDVVAAGGTTLQGNTTGVFTYTGESAWSGTSCDPSNNGGGGGGCSGHFSSPSYQANAVTLCGGYRALPDISLNANTAEMYVFNGVVQGTGGTSIVAPQLAGFFAQENAYLLAEGSICGSAGTSPCAPLGNANIPIYALGTHNPTTGAPHVPFYDVTSGCNGNSVGPGYCARSGYDLATGWGSVNMLQLAWGINWQLMPARSRATVTFSGPPTNHWFNVDQTVSWNVVDTGAGLPPSGVAGYSAAWDHDPGPDPSQDTPGCCDSFLTGPQVPNGTSGAWHLSAAGQGCHAVNVRAWDNTGTSATGSGTSSGQVGVVQYGPLCYDTVPPVTTASFQQPNGAGWINKGTVTLSATDSGSGVAATYDHLGQLCAGSCYTAYSGPLNLPDGKDTLSYYSVDNASNVETTHTVTLTVDTTPPQTVAALAGTPANNGYTGSVQVTLTPSDSLSGVQTTQYEVDGGSPQTYNGPFQVAGTGTHSVTFYSVDKAGNQEHTKATTFTIYAGSSTLTPAPTAVPGTAQAWGANASGQLGAGTYSTTGCACVPVPGPVSALGSVVAVAGGAYHSLALRADGTVWAWGLNRDGELGTGTTTSSATPVQVSGLSGVIAVAAGGHFSLALRADGTVWAWGFNRDGELGTGTLSTSGCYCLSLPRQVGSLAGVVAIAAGNQHSLALTSDGTVWAWGDDTYDQLGYIMTQYCGTDSQGNPVLCTGSGTPQAVSGLGKAVAIGAGGEHSLALRADGTVWAWGGNGYGQLGTGTTVGSNTPTPAQVSGLAQVIALAAGQYHSLALRADGTVWAWGGNGYGQLGTGTTVNSSTPVAVSGLSGVTALAAGQNHSLAVAASGRAWTWGRGVEGELGTGATASSTVPVQVGGVSSVEVVAGGGAHSVAITH